MSKPQLTKEKWGWNIFAKCECLTHAIEVNRFQNDDGAYDDEVYISFWYCGHRDYTLWQRIKMAWRVLTGHTVEVEEIILDRDDIRHLGEELIRAADSK